MFTTHRFKQLALRTIAVAFPLTVALSIPMATSANELRCENLRPSAGVTTGEEDGHTAFYGTRGDDIVCGLGRRRPDPGRRRT